MSRWTEYAVEANQECLNEFYSTLDHWIDKREQEAREQQDNDPDWIEEDG